MSNEKNIPDTVEPLDHARYRAACAELESINLKIILLQREAAELESKKNEITSILCTKYLLIEGDQILSDGKIARKKE